MRDHVRGQDHRVHIEIHQKIQENPAFQQLLQQAQAVGFDGQPVYPAATQQLQQLIQLRDQHIGLHEQAQAQEQEVAGAPQSPGPSPSLSIEGTVRGNAQRVQNPISGEAQQAGDGA